MYKTTAMTTGYGQPSVGSTLKAKQMYGSDMGMTLLRSFTNNESSEAKNKVVFSVGPFSQNTGVREVDPTDPNIYRRNPMNQRMALTSSVLLSGVGLAGAYAAYQAAQDRNFTTAAVYGATSLVGLAMLPNWELRL